MTPGYVEHRKVSSLIEPYLQGYGFDLGSGDIPVKNAQGIDLHSDNQDVVKAPVLEYLMDIPKDSVDFIFTSFYLESEPKYMNVLEESVRVLRPGGKLILFQANKDVFRDQDGNDPRGAEFNRWTPQEMLDLVSRFNLNLELRDDGDTVPKPFFFRQDYWKEHPGLMNWRYDFLLVLSKPEGEHHRVGFYAIQSVDNPSALVPPQGQSETIEKDGIVMGIDRAKPDEIVNTVVTPPPHEVQVPEPVAVPPTTEPLPQPEEVIEEDDYDPTTTTAVPSNTLDPVGDEPEPAGDEPEPAGDEPEPAGDEPTLAGNNPVDEDDFDDPSVPISTPETPVLKPKPSQVVTSRNNRVRGQGK